MFNVGSVYRYLAALLILSAITSGVWRYTDSLPHLGGADFAIAPYELILLASLPFVVMSICRGNFFTGSLIKGWAPFFLACSISSLFSLEKGLALLEVFRMVELLFMAAIFYRALRFGEEWLWFALLVYCAAQFFGALLQYMKGGSALLGGEAESVFLNEGIFRAAGFMGHPNTLSLIMLVIFCLFLGRSFLDKGLQSRFLVIIPLMLLVITLSRSALIAVFVVFSYWFLFLSNRVPLVNKLVYLVVAGCVFIILGWLFGGAIIDRFDVSQETNISSRVQLNLIALRAFKDHWLFGAGFNNFTSFMWRYDETVLSTYFEHPVHNIFLLYLSEGGIIAAAGLLYFLYWLYKGLRCRDENDSLKLGAEFALIGCMVLFMVGWGFRLDVFQPFLALLMAIGARRKEERPSVCC